MLILEFYWNGVTHINTSTGKTNHRNQKQTTCFKCRTDLYRTFCQKQKMGYCQNKTLDNQALVRRLQRGISTGRWEGDLPLFWQRISVLLIQGTVCTWIPSHNKVPDWTPPDGWIDVHLCRVLNATADAQAGEVLRDSRSMIAAAVQRHQRAVAWAAAVWRLQRLRTLPFWQVVLDQQTFHAEC